MREVQKALKDIGIPVMEGVWKPVEGKLTPPEQYVVYSCTTKELAWNDDHPGAYRTYVYLDLWSKRDTTPMANTIRRAMYAAGFTMVEETNKGYNQPAYEHMTDQYTVQWTWCLITEEDAYGDGSP